MDAAPVEVETDARALVPSDGGLMVDSDRMMIGEFFEWGPTGLNVLGRPPMGVAEEMVRMLSIAEKSLQFAIGDMMNWAEGTFGEEGAQLIPDNAWTESTQRNYQWVAGKIPKHIRNEKLSFYHHQKVANLNSPEEQKMWLDRALEGTDGKMWTAKELEKAMNAAARDVIFKPKEPKFFVVIECTGNDDMQACCRQLDNLGRKYKTKVPAAAAGATTPEKAAD